MQSNPASIDPVGGVPACSSCGSPAKDAYFSTSGQTLCRNCHSAEQIGAQDARAMQSVAAEAPPGFTPTRLREETRASRVRSGWIGFGACVASTIFTAVLLNRIYLWSGILGVFALGSFARALKLPRLDGRRGNLGVGIGIAATLLLLFGILAITLLGC
jgi:hypothetical protein